MAQLALEVQNNAPSGRGPATTSIPSSFTVALDTVSNSNRLKNKVKMLKLSQVQLAQTFLGIAESLRKPRGSLIHRSDSFLGIGHERSQSQIEFCVVRMRIGYVFDNLIVFTTNIHLNTTDTSALIVTYDNGHEAKHGESTNEALIAFDQGLNINTAMKLAKKSDPSSFAAWPLTLGPLGHAIASNSLLSQFPACSTRSPRWHHEPQWVKLRS